jgi:hypothetical protein
MSVQGRLPSEESRGGRVRKAAMWSIAVLLAAGLVLAGVLGAYGGRSSRFSYPASAHFRLTSSYLPNPPADVPRGVPIGQLDPGMMGWSGLVLGRVIECNPQSGHGLTVALLQGSRFVAGSIPNQHGGFDLAFTWPDRSVNGGGPQNYTLLVDAGATQQTQPLVLDLDHITYTVVPESC